MLRWEASPSHPLLASPTSPHAPGTPLTPCLGLAASKAPIQPGTVREGDGQYPEEASSTGQSRAPPPGCYHIPRARRRRRFWACACACPGSPARQCPGRESVLFRSPCTGWTRRWCQEHLSLHPTLLPSLWSGRPPRISPVHPGPEHPCGGGGCRVQGTFPYHQASGGQEAQAGGRGGWRGRVLSGWCQRVMKLG